MKKNEAFASSVVCAKCLCSGRGCQMLFAIWLFHSARWSRKAMNMWNYKSILPESYCGRRNFGVKTSSDGCRCLVYRSLPKMYAERHFRPIQFGCVTSPLMNMLGPKSGTAIDDGTIQPFNYNRTRTSTSVANAGTPNLALLLLQHSQQRRHDPCSTCSERMP